MSKSKKTEQVVIVLTPEEFQTVEDYRFENRVPSRSEAVRQLIRMGLKAIQKKNNKL